MKCFKHSLSTFKISSVFAPRTIKSAISNLLGFVLQTIKVLVGTDPYYRLITFWYVMVAPVNVTTIVAILAVAVYTRR